MYYDNNVPVREIDFDEDEWKHDHHYIVTDKIKRSIKLVEVQTLHEIEDENIKL